MPQNHTTQIWNQHWFGLQHQTITWVNFDSNSTKWLPEPTMNRFMSLYGVTRPKLTNTNIFNFSHGKYTAKEMHPGTHFINTNWVRLGHTYVTITMIFCECYYSVQLFALFHVAVYT